MDDEDAPVDPGETASRRAVLAALGAAGVGATAGCIGGSADGGSTPTDGGPTPSAGEPTPTDGAGDATPTGGSGPDSGGSWRSAELTDVLEGETFTIGGLEGPVVVQSFAVWCPKCQRQSEAIATLDDSLTAVGLNIDPNEDAEKVRDHATGNGFDWRFAVAPPAMTDSLVAAFGTTVTNAPSTPVIVDCGPGDAEFMSGSINSAEEIEAAADDC